MGEKAAMACTVAVEKVIGNHYKEQVSFLAKDQKKLKSILINNQPKLLVVLV